MNVFARMAVARGAALLDKKLPGWREKIDLDTFDITLCSKCILGQLFNVPEKNLSRFRQTVWDLGISWVDVPGYGFISEMIRYSDLQDAWVEELTKEKT